MNGCTKPFDHTAEFFHRQLLCPTTVPLPSLCPTTVPLPSPASCLVLTQLSLEMGSGELLSIEDGGGQHAQALILVVVFSKQLDVH